MKKKSSAKPAKKKAKTKAVTKSARATGQKKAPAASRKSADERERASGYTPPAVQGIGWAPFRYPPQ